MIRRVEVVSYIIKAVTPLESITLHSRDGGSKNIFKSFDLQTRAPTLEFPVLFENPLLKLPLVLRPNTCSGDSSLMAPAVCFLFCIKGWCFGACSALILSFPLSIQFLSPGIK